MFKRIALVVISLLFLHSCDQLLQMTGESSNYSPVNSDIQISDISPSGFTLSWNETVYDDGTHGNFFYEVFVIEGVEYDTYNFSKNDIVASGWGLTTCLVSNLTPGNTYSYVVGVSEENSGSLVFYTMSTVTITSDSPDFVGQWQIGMYDHNTSATTHYIYTFDEDYCEIAYFVNGELVTTYTGTLNVISSDQIRLDVDGDIVTLTWSTSGELLTLVDESGDGAELYPYSGELMIIEIDEPEEIIITEDLYELDNTYQDAINNDRVILIGETQYHTIHTEGDEDWIMFNAEAGSIYIITTSFATKEGDSKLTLYDTDGITSLSFNDDSGAGWFSQINFTFNTTGTYFIKVTDYDFEVDYNITVEEVVSNGNGGIDLVIQ